MLIFIPTLVFWISDPKSIFGQIWAKKVKLVHFTWKLVHVISRFLILVPILVFWISKPKSIFGQIWTKKLKVVQFGWNWHTECLNDVDSYSNITFPYIFFWKNLGWKIQSCSFWLKVGTHGISRTLILIPTTVFWIANPKSIFGQIWAENVKAVSFSWKLAHKHIHTQYFEDVDSYFDISFLKFQT